VAKENVMRGKKPPRDLVVSVLKRATRYVQGYLENVPIAIEHDFSCPNPWIAVTVVMMPEVYEGEKRKKRRRGELIESRFEE